MSFFWKSQGFYGETIMIRLFLRYHLTDVPLGSDVIRCPIYIRPFLRQLHTTFFTAIQIKYSIRFEYITQRS